MHTNNSERLWDELPIGHPAASDEQTQQVCYVDTSGRQVQSLCNRQIFLSFNVQFCQPGKLITLVDTGADVNLITDKYLRTQVQSWKQFEDCKEVTRINGITGQAIKPLAYKLLPIVFDNLTVVLMPFVIMPDTLPVKCILGRPALVYLEASLLFFTQKGGKTKEPCDKHYYVLKISHPRPSKIPLLHLAMPGLFQVTSLNVRLKAKQSTSVTFQLKINPFLTENSQCIVSSHDTSLPKGVTMFDTKCTPTFTRTGLVTVTAVLVNDTDQVIKLNKCTALLEEIQGQHEMVAITKKPEAKQSPYPALDISDSYEQVEELPNSSKKVYLVSHVNQGPNKKYRKFLKKSQAYTEESLEELSFPHYHCDSVPQESVYRCCRIQISDKKGDYEEPFQTADELLEEEIMPSISLPTKLPSAADVVLSSIEREPKDIQPYLRRIFIEKYPTVVGTHNLDTGPVRYLGRIQLRTKPGMKLPKSTKVYAIHPSDQQHLDDILSFMEKYGFISEVFQDDPSRPSAPHGAAAYLIKRKLIKGGKNEGAPSFARLIIDYRTGGLNSILQDTPALVKGIETCLEELRGSFLFSLIDLKQSYYGLCLHSNSFALTQFLAFPGRSFVWHRLPMGVSTAPASLLEKCNLMLNFVPQRDKEGNVMFEPGEDPKDEASRALLVPDKITNCINFYDDLLIYSPKSQLKEGDDLKQSKKEHFDLVERLIGRMALFQFKITYPKCSWGKRFVDFLGWRVQDDRLIADENRIEKVRKFDYPKSRKSLQSFVGLVNTLKRVAPLTTGEHLAVLSSAISSKKKFSFSEEHKEAFDKLKAALTSQPLYCHLINPHADKIIFTDSSSLAFGSVLLSRIDHQKTPTFQSHIDQEDPDPLNQVIRKWQVKAYIGEKYSRAEDSFFQSILFLIRYNRLHYDFKDTLELRHAVIKHVKSTQVGQQVKTQFCNSQSQVFHNFLHHSLGNTRAAVSAQDVTIYLVASFLKRGINVLKADVNQESCPLHEIIPDNSQAATPLTVGMYPLGGSTTAGHFVPLLEYKDWEFNPALLNSRYVINYYDSKIIPVAQRSKSILELEATALLHALKKYRNFITNCKVHVVTDSRSLFYLFSQAIVQSHTKVSRFNLKLQADYPQVQVLWCSTVQNLADIFTRFGLAEEYETKIKFSAVKVEKLPEIPEGMTFSWQNWDNIVRTHPQALEILLDYAKTYQTKDKKKLEKIHKLYTSTDTKTAVGGSNIYHENDTPLITNARQPAGNIDMKKHSDLVLNVRTMTGEVTQSGTKSSINDTLPQGSIQLSSATSTGHTAPSCLFTKIGMDHLQYLTRPIAVIQQRLSKENIMLEQREELHDLYTELTRERSFHVKKGRVIYCLDDGLIYGMDRIGAEHKLVLPKNMEMLALAKVHLHYGHSSIESTIKTLGYTYMFYDGKMRDKVALFCRSCTACAINARDTSKIALRHLSLDPNVRPFYYTCLDLAEKVTPFGSYDSRVQYNHLLIIKCLTTSYTLVFPLRDRTSREVLYCVLYGLIGPFGVPGMLYSDNASILRAHLFVQHLEALGVQVKETVPYDSKSRGFIERTVRSVKVTIRKLLNSMPDRENNMIEILPLISGLHINNNINLRTMNSPARLVFGSQLNTNGLFGTLENNNPHMEPLFRRGAPQVSSLPEIIKEEKKNVASSIKSAENRADKSVRRPVQKSLPPGTLIFVLNQGEGTDGVSPTWTPYYLPSLYVVTRELKTAIMASRISDQQTVFRSKNAVKRARYWNRMEELPEQVRQALFLNYDELKQEQLNQLAGADRFGPLPEQEIGQNVEQLLEQMCNEEKEEELADLGDWSSEESDDDEENAVHVPQLEEEDSDSEDEHPSGYNLRRNPKPRVTFNLPN